MDSGTPIQILDLNERDKPKRDKPMMPQREAFRHLQSYGGDEAIDHVMNCVRLYCDSALDAQWHLTDNDEKLFRRKGPATPPDAKMGPEDLYKLLENPNPYMDYEELISLLMIDLLLVGNAYWFKWRNSADGKPMAIYRLAPPYVKVVPGDMGVLGYEYEVPGSGQREPLKIDPAEVVHFKLPNPHSPYYGLGVIQGGGRPLDLELALTDHQASYYEKGTNPSMIVQSERRVSKDVFKKLKAQLRGNYGGPRNAGSLMVLEAGLKATTITPNAADAQFEPITKLSRDRVMAMFRVPPRLLGLMDEGTSGDKSADYQRVFDQKAVKPLLGLVSRRISRQITQAWDVDLVIDYRYVMPKEDQVKLAGDFASIPGVTVREVRDFLDLPPTGDKEIDDLVLNLPGDEAGTGQPGDPTRQGIPDRNLPREAGRPPNGSSTRAIGTVGSGVNRTAGAKVRSQKAGIEETQARLQRIIDLAPEDVIEVKALPELEAPDNVTIGRRLDNEQRPNDGLRVQRDDEINRIAAQTEKDLLAAIHVLERELLDVVDGKAFRPNDIRSRIRNSEAWKTFREMLSQALENAAMRGLSAAAIQHGTKGIAPEDEIDYDALAKELVFRKNGVNAITNNLRNEMAQKIAKALKEEQSREQVEQMVRESMDFWRESHAETVALTEAVHAYNEGTLAVLEATGHTEVYVEDGDEDDEPCIEANRSVWPIEHARENRLEHPRCRRAFLPLDGVL